MLIAVEQALKARLEETAAALNLNQVKIDQYGGQLDTELLDEVIQSCPGAWLVFTGMKPGRRMSRDTEMKFSFGVIVGATSLEGDMSRQGGRGGLVVGAYELIDFAGKALDRFQPEGLLTAPLECVGVQNLFNARVGRNHLAVYGVNFEGALLWDHDFPNDLDDFEIIEHGSKPSYGDGDPVNTTIPQKDEE